MSGLFPLRLNVTGLDQIRAVAEVVLNVRLVISNAGLALPLGFGESADIDDARREMEVNYFCPLQLMQRLAPTLAKMNPAQTCCMPLDFRLSGRKYQPTLLTSLALAMYGRIMKLNRTHFRATLRRRSFDDDGSCRVRRQR
jgi:NAD(P)-dependent dehydrogenase (short-subunit alcohol dehydrogenase family)